MLLAPHSRSLCILALVAAPALAACASSDPSPADDVCGPGFVTRVVSVEYGAQAGFGQASMPQIVVGPPHGAGLVAGSLDVVSLGLDGTIVVGFAQDGILDEPGPDFIVYENAFFAGGDSDSPFAEPGTVSASDDTVQWTSWPCDLSAPPYAGCAGTHPVLSNPDNDISPFDAGQAGGEAFDLAAIGLSRARYVRIQGSSMVPTAAGTSGFDLDAVAVLHPACR